MIYVLAILIGVAAGLRSATPIAAICWAAWLGWIDLSATPVNFLGSTVAVAITTLLAVVELFGDKLPTTPSRKAPAQFGARVVTGGIAGALLMPENWIVGAILGAVGAAIGTLLGAEARSRLATTFGRDLPAALIEDAVAILAAILIVYIS
jgi:uncharacterized membrane protein